MVDQQPAQHAKDAAAQKLAAKYLGSIAPSRGHTLDGGGVHKAFAALTAEAGAALERDLTALLNEFNLAGPASLVIPGQYLEVIVERR